MMTTTTTKTTTNLEQFYQELLKDPMLQERLKATTDPENLCELAVELGKEKGYTFTKEEVLAAIAIEVAIGEGGIKELTDEALTIRGEQGITMATATQEDFCSTYCE